MRYAVIHKTSIVVESDCQSECALIVRQNSCWFIWLLLLNTALSWIQVLVRDYVFIFEKRSDKNVLIWYNNIHLHMKETPNYQKSLCFWHFPENKRFNKWLILCFTHFNQYSSSLWGKESYPLGLMSCLRKVAELTIVGNGCQKRLSKDLAAEKAI